MPKVSMQQKLFNILSLGTTSITAQYALCKMYSYRNNTHNFTSV